MGVAQLVEPRIVIPVVVGSSPIVHPSLCGRGEIGRRTGFRFQRVTVGVRVSPSAPNNHLITPQIISWSSLVYIEANYGAFLLCKKPSMKQSEQSSRCVFLLLNLHEPLAKDVKIIYGGSLEPSNANKLLNLADVDGG